MHPFIFSGSRRRHGYTSTHCFIKLSGFLQSQFCQRNLCGCKTQIVWNPANPPFFLLKGTARSKFTKTDCYQGLNGGGDDKHFSQNNILAAKLVLPKVSIFVINMVLNVAASQYIGGFSLPDSWMLSNKQYGDI